MKITYNQMDESFLTCPYDYYDHELHEDVIGTNWKQEVQHTVNKIVYEFFETPFSKRTNGYVIKIISDYWCRLDRTIFDSIQQFLSISAVVIDHLMSFLENNKHFKLSGAFDPYSIMELQNGSETVIFEKMLLEVDEHLLKTYYDVAKRYYFTKHGFFPRRIEVVDLIHAKRYVHFPT
ncbi:hypothetical protein N0O92_21110 [Alkalihalobacillus sp. MEB130]|uniref:hypothetical protein n=1 Tax=Alkalihalobacillus sp. MEB130 TaxID=2976704 RepID=UPI0028DF524B|nr:hypothetical protein [Alkalihalobacillus sp. MEB130]MDT8862703.1 hypothetical protein [Alkalihalobacillus sp. MEB130]